MVMDLDRPLTEHNISEYVREGKRRAQLRGFVSPPGYRPLPLAIAAIAHGVSASYLDVFRTLRKRMIEGQVSSIVMLQDGRRTNYSAENWLNEEAVRTILVGGEAPIDDSSLGQISGEIYIKKDWECCVNIEYCLPTLGDIRREKAALDYIQLWAPSKEYNWMLEAFRGYREKGDALASSIDALGGIDHLSIDDGVRNNLFDLTFGNISYDELPMAMLECIDRQLIYKGFTPSNLMLYLDIIQAYGLIFRNTNSLRYFAKNVRESFLIGIRLLGAEKAVAVTGIEKSQLQALADDTKKLKIGTLKSLDLALQAIGHSPINGASWAARMYLACVALANRQLLRSTLIDGACRGEALKRYGFVAHHDEYPWKDPLRYDPRERVENEMPLDCFDLSVVFADDEKHQRSPKEKLLHLMLFFSWRALPKIGLAIKDVERGLLDDEQASTCLKRLLERDSVNDLRKNRARLVNDAMIASVAVVGWETAWRLTGENPINLLASMRCPSPRWEVLHALDDGISALGCRRWNMAAYRSCAPLPPASAATRRLKRPQPDRPLDGGAIEPDDGHERRVVPDPAPIPEV